MKVAVLGGTGKLGMGLAARLARAQHEVVIGSRELRKAEEAARAAAERIRGMINIDAARWCDLAIVSVPYQGHRATVESVKDVLAGKIVIDATVPIDPSNILQVKTETGVSAAEETAAIVAGAEVFAAFQTVSHRVLRQPGVSHDVLVTGPSARKMDVMELIRSMDLRPVDAGPLEVARHVERMTVLLLSINKANKVKESSFKVTGV